MNYIVGAFFIICGIMIIIKRKAVIWDKSDNIIATLKGTPAIWIGVVFILIGIAVVVWF